MKRIGIFGSSLNPPTGIGGHESIVRHFAGLSKEMGGMDEIWVLPVYQHIFDTKRGTLAPFEHRVEMAKRCFEPIDPEKVKVKDYERVLCEIFMNEQPKQQHSGRVGTFDILTFLKELQPETQFVLLLGADTFLDLTLGKWKRSEELLTMVDFGIFERKGVDPLDHSKLGSNVNVHVIPDLADVSSTLARAAMESGDLTTLQKMVCEAVYQYIVSNKLYSNL